MPDFDIRHIIENELTSGERLLWSGAPQKAYWSPLMMFYVIFILIWLLGVLGFLFAGLSQMGKGSAGMRFVFVPAVMTFVGLLFLWITIKALRGPAKQLYGLTDRRGLIIENFGKGPVRSLGPNELANLTRKSASDTMGTLKFQGPSFTQFSFDLSNLMGVAFYNITNPRDVENIIFSKILQNRS